MCQLNAANSNMGAKLQHPFLLKNEICNRFATILKDELKLPRYGT